jgi:hypothetical protein
VVPLRLGNVERVEHLQLLLPSHCCRLSDRS